MITSVATVVNADEMFIQEHERVGAFPGYDGGGWRGEAYFLPDESAGHLLAAEAYMGAHEPDFTFHTTHIDFPAGPVSDDWDGAFETIGDFLSGYLSDVSEPSKLDEPFGHIALRFTGLLKISLDLDFGIEQPNGPVQLGSSYWIWFGVHGMDGYRVRFENSLLRIPIVNYENPFYYDWGIAWVPGLYPIEVTCFNRFDPEATNDPPLDRAGIELYAFYDSGLNYPGGADWALPGFGPASIVPPDVIYQRGDALPVPPGDYDADSDADFADWQWVQSCFTGPVCESPCFLHSGCHAFDFDDDHDVDLEDVVEWQKLLTGAEDD